LKSKACTTWVSCGEQPHLKLVRLYTGRSYSPSTQEEGSRFLTQHNPSPVISSGIQRVLCRHRRYSLLPVSLGHFGRVSLTRSLQVAGSASHARFFKWQGQPHTLAASGGVSLTRSLQVAGSAAHARFKWQGQPHTLASSGRGSRTRSEGTALQRYRYHTLNPARKESDQSEGE
jgi:hypothetical protein